MLKWCLVLVTFYIVTICAVKHFPTEFQRHQYCHNESKVDLGILRQIYETKTWLHTKEVDTFLECMMKQEGSMSDDGVVDFSPIYDRNPAALECQKLRGSTDTETAGKVMECIMKVTDFKHGK